MMSGVTKSGFSFTLDDDVFDDYELLEVFSDVDAGETSRIFEAGKLLLGKEQHDALKNHVRGNGGRVSAKKMIEEITEIMASCKKGKN